jgi:branched-chain amino acid transport system substrate-binding protein
MRFKRFSVLLSLVLVAAACNGDGDDGGDETTNGDQAEACTESYAVGVSGPFTGDAASIGQEQLNFAQLAVQIFNEENGTDFQIVEGDTQLDPAQASTVAQQFVSDDNILAVVGPAGSPEVEATGPIFERAEMAFLGMSATLPTLTDGTYPTFFRVVPHDDIQGPTDAEYMVETLGAEEVFIIDDQTSYSTGLADVAQGELEGHGATVSRESVSQDETDYSALVSRITDGTDVVFLPWQIAANGQLFAQQMDEQGKEAVIFGSDGLFAPQDFSAEGAYVSSFAPDITGVAEAQDVIDLYNETFDAPFETTFGPPTYVATQVALEAMNAACTEGDATRASVLERVGDVTIEDSILGGPIAFDENGDVEGARFYIFQIVDGEYTLVQ